MKIDNTTFRLPSGQYLSQSCVKTQIVLHHTVGGSAKSAFDWWKKDQRRIATAYIIEKDGTIYEVFPHECWAYHLGTGNPNDEAKSIGIELVSEGGLIESDGSLYCFDRISPRTLFNGEVYDHGNKWRYSYRYFDVYDEPQIRSLEFLLSYLFETFPSISRKTPSDHYLYDPGLLKFSGVIGHHHVRRDKTDVHPGFPWKSVVENCGIILG